MLQSFLAYLYCIRVHGLDNKSLLYHLTMKTIPSIELKISWWSLTKLESLVHDPFLINSRILIKRHVNSEQIFHLIVDSFFVLAFPTESSCDHYGLRLVPFSPCIWYAAYLISPLFSQLWPSSIWRKHKNNNIILVMVQSSNNTHSSGIFY